MNAGAHIGGPTYDLQGFGLPHIQLADAQLAGVRVGLTVEHPAHDHALGLGRQVFDALHLEAGDRESLSEGLQGQLQIRVPLRTPHQLPQPLV